MAGPSVSIIVAFEDRVPTWRNVLEPYASSWHDACSCGVSDTTEISGRYSGEPRPFVGSIEKFEISRADDSGEALMRDAIIAKVGVAITHEIIIAAMCNQPSDHAILCALAAEIADQRKGFVDFNCLVTGSDAGIEGLVRCEWTFGGESDWTLIGTAAAARRWMSHPDFHMLK